MEKLKFKNKKMKFKCSKCGFECMHLAEAFEHRDYDNNFGCDGLILTPETIEEYNTYLNKKSEQQNNKPEKGSLGCKDSCIDYPDCHPTCRIRWYHK